MTPSAYTSILEAPLDEYSLPDVGDSNPTVLSDADLSLMLRAATPAGKTNPVPIVPFTRTIKAGSVGRDVVGAKRAIWKANGLPIPVGATRLFGPVAVTQLRKFQKRAGVRVDGQLGPATLRALGPFFDQLAFLDYAGYPPGGSKEERMRDGIVAYALWGYNNRGQIGYAEYRPMAFMAALYQLPVSEDCSTLTTKEYKSGGAPDPNGLDYDGAGNTETQRAHGRLVPSIAQAKPGDLIHYDDPQHVAVYVGHGRVISHGSQIGPLLLPYDYRPVAEIRTYLDLALAA